MGALQTKEDGFTPLLTKGQCIGVVPSSAVAAAQLLVDYLCTLEDVRKSTWKGVLVCENAFIGLPLPPTVMVLQCRFGRLYPHFPEPWKRPPEILAMPLREADVAVMPHKRAMDFSQQIDCIREWIDNKRPVYMEIGSGSDDYVVSIVLGRTK